MATLRRLDADDREHPTPRLACLEEDPELFFPPGESEQHRDQIDEAKAVCRRCPVVTECLEIALRAGTGLHGVWGATSNTDRTRMLRSAHRRR